MLKSLTLSMALFATPSIYADDLREHLTIQNVFGAEFENPRIRSAVFSPDGKLLVTASETGLNDGTIVWDPATGKEITKLEKGESLMTLAISPDGSKLAGSTSSYQYKQQQTWTNILIWEVKTGKCIGHLKKKEIFYGWLGFSPDEKSLAAGGVGDNDVQIWNVKSGKLIAELKPSEETGDVWSLAFSGDGKSLVVGYGKGVLRVWDVGNGRQTKVLKGHEDIVKAVAFHPSGKTIISAGKDKTVRKWDLANEKVSESFDLKDTATPMRVQFSSKVDSLAVADDQGGLAIWDIKTGTAICKLKDKHHCRALAYSPEGKWLAADYSNDKENKSDSSIQVWKIEKSNNK